MSVGPTEAESLSAVAPRTVPAPRPPPAPSVAAPASAAPVSVAPVSAAAASVASPPRPAVGPAPVAPPLRPTVAPAQVAPPPAPSSTRSGGTVLVAAADTGLRALAIAGLERGGYAVVDPGSQPRLGLPASERHSVGSRL